MTNRLRCRRGVSQRRRSPKPPVPQPFPAIPRHNRHRDHLLVQHSGTTLRLVFGRHQYLGNSSSTLPQPERSDRETRSGSPARQLRSQPPRSQDFSHRQHPLRYPARFLRGLLLLNGVMGRRDNPLPSSSPKPWKNQSGFEQRLRNPLIRRFGSLIIDPRTRSPALRQPLSLVGVRWLQPASLVGCS